MAVKVTQVTEPVSEVPQSTSICHFDEIEDWLQKAVVSMDKWDRSPVTVDSLQAALVDECGCNIVKFTDYYRVEHL